MKPSHAAQAAAFYAMSNLGFEVDYIKPVKNWPDDLDAAVTENVAAYCESDEMLDMFLAEAKAPFKRFSEMSIQEFKDTCSYLSWYGSFIKEVERDDA
jgi:hypothetical protein